MENSDSGSQDSPDSFQYEKRDAVALLFCLDSPRRLTIDLVQPQQSKFQQAPPHNADEKKTVPNTDQDLQVLDSFPEEGQELFKKFCNLPEKRVLPVWNTPPSAKVGQILDQSISHSQTPRKKFPLTIMHPLKSPESTQDIPHRKSREPFSYTDSEYFQFNEPRDLHSPDEISIKESTSSSSKNPAHLIQGAKTRNTIRDDMGEKNRKSLSSTKIVIVVLCLSLLVSLYFALFGSPVSFRNFFNSLTDERKEELSNELWIKYMSLPEVILKPKSQVNVSSRFDGITYSPEGSNEPTCIFTKEEAIRDIALISTITLKIRTYGTQCNQIEHILHAIRVLDFDLKISMGVWLSNDEEQNRKQINKAKQILLSPYTSPINSIFIGNEVLRRGDISENDLIFHIREMKKFLTETGLKIPVGTSESPKFASQALVDSSDVIGFTIHPFLAGIPASEAAQWCLDQFTGFKNQFHNGNTSFTITELGWPYQGGYFKKAEASPSDYRIFMHSWIEETSKHVSDDWYFFEAFNEPWKVRYNTEPNSWEAEWGLFDDEKKLRFDIENTDDNQI